MIEQLEAYRICERKNGKLYTLFHGIQGSREMPLNVWMEAEVKLVRDGSRGKAKEYLSGFHCIVDLDEMRDFKRMFRKERDLVLVKCKIEGRRRKEHSRANIILADKIKLLEVVEKLKIGKIKKLS